MGGAEVGASGALHQAVARLQGVRHQAGLRRRRARRRRRRGRRRGLRGRGRGRGPARGRRTRRRRAGRGAVPAARRASRCRGTAARAGGPGRCDGAGHRVGFRAARPAGRRCCCPVDRAPGCVHGPHGAAGEAGQRSVVVAGGGCHHRDPGHQDADCGHCDGRHEHSRMAPQPAARSGRESGRRRAVLPGAAFTHRESPHSWNNDYISQRATRGEVSSRCPSSCRAILRSRRCGPAGRLPGRAS
jgi:hypothetical protein